VWDGSSESASLDVGIVALSALLAGLVFLARKNWKMFAARVTVFLSGLVSGALFFVTGSETEKARLIETVIDFEGPSTSPHWFNIRSA
jgi:hypothetical protein